MASTGHRIFRAAWWSSNVLLAGAFVALLYTGGWARLSLPGLQAQRLIDRVYPGWDDALDWSLLLERESFFYFVLAATATLFFLLTRTMLGWYADQRLRIPRFHLREHALRAGSAFFSAPEIKE